MFERSRSTGPANSKSTLPGEQLFERDPDLEAGEMGTEAMMDPAWPEGDLRVGLATDVEGVGGVKDRLVAVPRRQPGGHLVPGGDPNAL